MNNSQLFLLVYASSAVKLCSRPDLLRLLEKAHRNNTRDGITGLLLYKDGNFMQALEGPEETVLRTFARISRDPRHHGVMTLLDGPLTERQFPSWSMGFRNLEDAKVRAIT